MSRHRLHRQGLFRALLIGYLILMALVVCGLGAELALRRSREASSADTKKHRKSNLFVAKAVAFGARRGLWAKRWERYRPHAYWRKKAGGRLFEVRMNRLGFRTHEFDIPKPAGVFRVICIGGSTTVQGETNETTYPAFLEARLRNRFPGREIEVLNLGISGTRSDHWLQPVNETDTQLRIQMLFDMGPDVIIQYNGANDIVQRYVQRYAEQNALRWALVKRSFLLQRLFSIDAARFDPMFEETFENFAAIAAESEAGGVHYLGATFAAPEYGGAEPSFRAFLDVTTALWTRGLLQYFDDYAALIARFNQRLEEFAAQRGLSLVPIAQTVTDSSDYIDLCHMETAGIERMAVGFVDAVAGLIEAAPAAALAEESASLQ